MLLVYLQIFVASLALILAIHPRSWWNWLCQIPGFGSVGVCACMEDTACWMDEMMYRALGAGWVVFVATALLAVSGCADAAAHKAPALKFILVLLLTVAFFFVPNAVFHGFYANLANVLCTLFIAAQSILLIDFGYTWNESWMGKSLEARRRDIRSHGGYKNWQTGILICSAALLLGSLGICIALWVCFDQGWWLVLLTLVLGVGCGIASISENLQSKGSQGNLLTSCVVLAYAVWLCYEALLSQPNSNVRRSVFLKWVGLGIAALSLFSSAFGDGLGLQKKPDALVASETEAAETGAAGAAGATGSAQPEGNTGAADADEGGPFDKQDFILQATIHSTAVLYVTVELAPKEGTLAFTFRTIGLILALLLYAWTLLAPVLLKNRSF
jgi:hypothetical protein